MDKAVSDRLQALRARMGEQGIDLIALGPGANMQWLLGFYRIPTSGPACCSSSGSVRRS